ncbi:MAG: hypothetical protein SF097_07090 [Acidobacteriota bacterium]|nr:hypothetical protein [Acidobacteriota bacterium]
MLPKLQKVALVLILAASQSLVAQAASQQPDGWNVVQAIPVGEQLLVELKDGKQAKGKLSAVSETELTLLKGSQSTTLNQTNIRRVFRLVGKTRGQSTLKGAGIGAATGAGIGLVIYLPARDDIVGSIVPGFGAIGAGIGAAIGAIGGSGQKKVLVYEVK